MMAEFADIDVSAWQEQGVVISVSIHVERHKRAVRRAPWSAVLLGAVALAGGSLSAVVHPGPTDAMISKAVEPFVADLGAHRGDPDFADAAYWKGARAFVQSLPTRIDNDAVEDQDPII